MSDIVKVTIKRCNNGYLKIFYDYIKELFPITAGKLNAVIYIESYITVLTNVLYRRVKNLSEDEISYIDTLVSTIFEDKINGASYIFNYIPEVLIPSNITQQYEYIVVEMHKHKLTLLNHEYKKSLDKKIRNYLIEKVILDV